MPLPPAIRRLAEPSSPLRPWEAERLGQLYTERLDRSVRQLALDAGLPRRTVGAALRGSHSLAFEDAVRIAYELGCWQYAKEILTGTAAGYDLIDETGTAWRIERLDDDGGLI